MNKLTYKTIAEKAGLSVMSVSNAIRRPEGVRPATLEKVRKAIQDLGGEIAEPQQASMKPVISHRPHRRLRFITGNIPSAVMETPVYGRVFQGLIEEAGEQNFEISVTNLDSPERLASGSFDENVDILILMGKWSSSLAPLKVPVVSMLSAELPFATDYVGYKQETVGRLIAGHFHRRGLRTVAYVGPHDHHRSTSFMNAFRVLDSEATVQSHFVDSPYQITGGKQSIDREVLEQLAEELTAKPPQGLFCHSDELAASLRHACIEKGHRWKETIWAGCNNDPHWRTLLGRNAVTVEICAAEIGRLAVRRAVEIARKPGQTKQTVLLEPYLVLCE